MLQKVDFHNKINLMKFDKASELVDKYIADKDENEDFTKKSLGIRLLFEKVTDFNFIGNHIACLAFDTNDEMGLKGSQCRFMAIPLSFYET